MEPGEINSSDGVNPGIGADEMTETEIVEEQQKPCFVPGSHEVYLPTAGHESRDR